MTTREDVLAALRAADGAEVSGEAIAGSLGVSRVAVAKHVSALRETGYVIDAEPGAGYRLRAVPDAPLPAEVAAGLVPLGDAAALWTRLEGGGVTGSTNDDARALALAGAAEGTVVLASRQTAGRGRLGRSWSSPAGGAYFSAVLRPRVAPADVAPLSLVVGLGVARGASALGAGDVRLKWPNDVLLGGGKLAGVLLEMAAESDRVEWVVAGVGINVRRPASDPAAPGAAYLEDAVPGVGSAQAVAAVLGGIAETYAVWTARGFGSLRAEYDAALALLGEHVHVRDLEGRVVGSGAVEGVDEGGRLLLRDAGGALAAVASGEVTLRERAHDAERGAQRR